MEVVKYRRWIRNCWFWDVVPTCRNVSRKEAKELRHQSICKAILRRNTSRQIVITTKEGTVAIISRKDAKGPRSQGVKVSICKAIFQTDTPHQVVMPTKEETVNIGLRKKFRKALPVSHKSTNLTFIHTSRLRPLSSVQDIFTGPSSGIKNCLLPASADL